MIDTARIAIKVSTNTAPSALVNLGKKLFMDENLSTPVGQSCASCHDVTSRKFIDTRARNTTSEGAKVGVFGGRNTPTAGYAAHIPNLVLVGGKKIGGQFWDGRTDSLEEQGQQPFLDPREMANPDKATVINKVKAANYANEFKAVFGANSLNNVDKAFVQISEAIAAFERSRIFSPFTSKWDAVQAGTATFTASEQRGFAAFKKGRCDTCHFTPEDQLGAQVFTNFKYENVGTPKNPSNPLLSEDPTFVDFGAGSAPDDAFQGPHSVNPPRTGKGQFKVPGLRNIAVTAPYMHNGVFDTLEQVIDFYNSQSIVGVDTTAEVGDTISDGGQYFSTLFETEQEKADLKAFLEALTDADLIE
jgi:cytochrome c peroxidase